MIEFSLTKYDPCAIECDGYVMVFPSPEAAQLAASAPDLAAENARLREALQYVSDAIAPEYLEFAGPHGTINVPFTRNEVDMIRAALAKTGS